MNYGKKHDLPFGIMDVAGLLRLNIRRRAPGQVYVDCPICGDRRGKMNLNTAKDLWRCNYCGEGGGMLSLYAKVYWERIEQQEAYILFLRKTAEIDKPYYTLEVEPNGTIRQKRTYFDRQNDDLMDAEKFLKEWQKVVSERLTENDREKAEKSKVLRLQEFEQLRQDDIRIHTGDLAGQRLVDVLVSDLMETAA